MIFNLIAYDLPVLIGTATRQIKSNNSHTVQLENFIVREAAPATISTFGKIFGRNDRCNELLNDYVNQCYGDVALFLHSKKIQLHEREAFLNYFKNIGIASGLYTWK